ncbi:MAG TPA: hypothetical protein VL461_12165 [Dictyobacter sp.]|jgi:predicted acylesterase/phospholipase RssA|nr:hypothetical protein [Dictyobacter sp.]
MSQEQMPLCDLVMKGGITSGIVYPPTVLALKDTYAFHNIGGTSAGAIGAAATAAAEYNRAGGGFSRLAQLSEQLQKNDTLLHFFKPAPATEPIFDVILEVLKQQQINQNLPHAAISRQKKPSSLTGRLLHFLFPALLVPVLQMVHEVILSWRKKHGAFRLAEYAGMVVGLVVGLLLAFLVAFAMLGSVAVAGRSVHSVQHTAWPLVFFFLGMVVLLCSVFIGIWGGRLIYTIVIFFQILQKGLPQNFYGICPGHTVPQTNGQQETTNLTDWLHMALQHIGGKTEPTPLTFGDLRKQDIELKMVTTNVNHSLPYIVPQELSNFLFYEPEMLRLFPAEVVKQLKVLPQQPLLPAELLPEGYHFLPDADDLPVVFGVRLSLSFPLLLSAVPLYTISASAYDACQTQRLVGKLDPQQHLLRNWFSDGGICSNFPIHFFDTWLPTRPTLGINLTETPKNRSILDKKQYNESTMDRQKRAQEQRADVYLPEAEEWFATEWGEIENLAKFVFGLFGTAQNYRDTLQSRLPGYRERIIQVRLSKEEGGMNLTMSPEMIQHVADKGREAGEALRQFCFEQHWWVRFLVLMAQLEVNLHDLQGMFEEHSLADLLQHEDFMTRLEHEWRSGQGGEQQRYPYYHDRAWCEEALSRVQALQVVINAWQMADQISGQGHFFQNTDLQPGATLRVTPDM